MLKDAQKLFVSRKLGLGQSPSYFLSRFLPSLLVLIISLLLSFALVMVHSMASAVDQTIQVLGSGTFVTYVDPSAVSLPSGSRIDRVRSASGLIYGKSGEGLCFAKGVEEGYFTPEKLKHLRIEGDASSLMVSAMMAKELSLSIGDKLVLAVYDDEKGRVRPIYLSLSGTYDSGYREFDSSLCYTSIDCIEGIDEYEILLSDGDDKDGVRRSLSLAGIGAEDYRVRYRALYQNVRLSIRLLTIVLLVIALLAGFFASNIAAEYVERDKKDIASLYILGMDSHEVASCYRLLSLCVAAIASFIGMVMGILLAVLASFLLSRVDASAYPALQNYVLNMSVRIPLSTLLLFYFALVSVSFLSLLFSLRHLGAGELEHVLAE